MDAKTLYIVGNGFDRQHGIPSDYQDFKAFVELHDDDVFGWVEEFIPAGEDWGHLESALAELDTGSICSGLMKPDTHLGENARQIEVSDDQTTPLLYS